MYRVYLDMDSGQIVALSPLCQDPDSVSLLLGRGPTLDKALRAALGKVVSTMENKPILSKDLVGQILNMRKQNMSW